MSLEGKTALVTGGGTGIGRAIAERFVREGASLIICGRRREVVEKTAREIRTDGGECRGVACDVTREEDLADLAKTAENHLGGIDILVNAAGIMLFKPTVESDRRLWDLLMDVNAYAPLRVFAHTFDQLKRRGGGAVINISSISGNRPFPGSAVYCASKAALQMLSGVMALEAAEHNIRVNCLSPGLVEDTELGREMFSPKQAEEAYERFKNLHPLGRNGKPADVAEAALFLAEERSSWITGAVIPVDGGRGITTNG
jgi:NAD(P)-dependent dehydrogenase (short-subunit alcohol dehydrogenase family)